MNVYEWSVRETERKTDTWEKLGEKGDYTVHDVIDLRREIT